MTHRTDAAVFLRLIVPLAALSMIGCLAPNRFVTPTPPPTPTLLVPVEIVPASATAEPGELARLYGEAVEAYAKVDSYIARFRRREVVRGSAKPAELMEFSYRQKPMSVRFKWIGEVGKGREVLYVQGQHDDKLHIRMAAGDNPFAAAGTRMSLSPDSPLVRGGSRHSIREAGVGATIERFGKILADIQAGKLPTDTARVLGPVQREEYPHPLTMVEIKVPGDAEEALPGGGVRLVGFDPKTRFPVLIVTHDAKGLEVEHYCYDRFQLSVHLDDKDFDPLGERK